MNLWYLDIDAGKPIHVDTNPYDGANFSPAWSPDSRWIAYTRQLDSTLHAVFIYGVEDKNPHQITDGLSDTASAAFDKNGKYLYFFASTDVGPTLASSMGAFKIPVTRSAYVVVLNKDLKSPLAPQSDEEKVASDKSAAPSDDCKPAGEAKPDEKSAAEKADKGADKSGEAKKDEKKDEKKGEQPAKDSEKTPEVKIDFENINQRILALPIPARNYDTLLAGKTHVLYLLEGPIVNDGTPSGHIVHKFDICTRKTDKLLDNIGGFTISSNGEKALYEQLPPRNPLAAGGGPPHGSWAIKPVDAIGKPSEPGKPDGTLHLEGMKVYVDPRAEWEQMFREVGRIERDFFYDPNLHGANLKALMAAYQPYVDNVMSRADLNYIFADMLGEITAQHVYIFGGDRPEVKPVSVGLLGADYTIDHDRYRFAKVYFGENWNPGSSRPSDGARRQCPSGRISPRCGWAGSARQRRNLQLLPRTRRQRGATEGGAGSNRKRCPHGYRRSHRRRAQSPLARLDGQQSPQGRRTQQQSTGLRLSPGYRGRGLHQFQPLLFPAERQAGRRHRRTVQRRWLARRLYRGLVEPPSADDRHDPRGQGH